MDMRVLRQAAAELHAGMMDAQSAHYELLEVASLAGDAEARERAHSALNGLGRALPILRSGMEARTVEEFGGALRFAVHILALHFDIDVAEAKAGHLSFPA